MIIKKKYCNRCYIFRFFFLVTILGNQLGNPLLCPGQIVVLTPHSGQSNCQEGPTSRSQAVICLYFYKITSQKTQHSMRVIGKVSSLILKCNIQCKDAKMGLVCPLFLVVLSSLAAALTYLNLLTKLKLSCFASKTLRHDQQLFKCRNVAD